MINIDNVVIPAFSRCQNRLERGDSSSYWQHLCKRDFHATIKSSKLTWKEQYNKLNSWQHTFTIEWKRIGKIANKKPDSQKSIEKFSVALIGAYVTSTVALLLLSSYLMHREVADLEKKCNFSVQSYLDEFGSLDAPYFQKVSNICLLTFSQLQNNMVTREALFNIYQTVERACIYRNGIMILASSLFLGGYGIISLMPIKLSRQIRIKSILFSMTLFRIPKVFFEQIIKS